MEQCNGIALKKKPQNNKTKQKNKKNPKEELDLHGAENFLLDEIFLSAEVSSFSYPLL